jgi:hypothetical protein
MKTDDTNTKSAAGADSLDRIVGHFNEVFQCDYTADDLRWDIHNGDKTAVAFVRGWEQAMDAVWQRLPAEEYLDDPIPAEMKSISRFVKSNLPNDLRQPPLPADDSTNTKDAAR